MSRLALLTLSAVLAIVPAASAAPSGSLIVPGKAIGSWTLAMPLDQLVRALGPYYACSTLGAETDLRTDWYCWPQICASSPGTLAIMYLYTTVAGSFARTEKGIGIGSLRPAVLAAYGPPTMQRRVGDESAGYLRLVYDAIGLTVRVNLITDTVISIGVFRPGSAGGLFRL